MIPVLVFDIETIPDVEGLRLLAGLSPEVPDAEVAAQAFATTRGSESGRLGRLRTAKRN